MTLLPARLFALDAYRAAAAGGTKSMQGMAFIGLLLELEPMLLQPG